MFALSHVPAPDVAGFSPAPAQKSWAEAWPAKMTTIKSAMPILFWIAFMVSLCVWVAGLSERPSQDNRNSEEKSLVRVKVVLKVRPGACEKALPGAKPNKTEIGRA